MPAGRTTFYPNKTLTQTNQLKDQGFQDFIRFDHALQIQRCALENQQNPFYVVNEVTLTGPNPFLKVC